MMWMRCCGCGLEFEWWEGLCVCGSCWLWVRCGGVSFQKKKIRWFKNLYNTGNIRFYMVYRVLYSTHEFLRAFGFSPPTLPFIIGTLICFRLWTFDVFCCFTLSRPCGVKLKALVGLQQTPHTSPAKKIAFLHFLNQTQILSDNPAIYKEKKPLHFTHSLYFPTLTHTPHTPLSHTHTSLFPLLPPTPSPLPFSLVSWSVCGWV